MVASRPKARLVDVDAPPPTTFDGIYRAYAPLVARWAQRLGGPDIDLDEVVQEVFLTVNRRLADFRGEAKVTTWLFRITTRVVSNQRRAQRRRGRRWRFLSRDVCDEIEHDGPGPGERLEEREAVQRFYLALDRLPKRHRDVLVMFELEEMSTDGIATLVGRPPATVRVWLHRARAQFARDWEALS